MVVGLETLVVLLVILWALRRLFIDAAFAVRGLTPPTIAARAERAQRRAQRRYGARNYFADVWSQSWQDATTRRTRKRDARTARRAAGQPRFRRLRAAAAAFGSWWRSAGGSRRIQGVPGPGGTGVDTRTTTRWDRAWARVEARRAAGKPGWLGRLGRRLGLTRRRGQPTGAARPRDRAGLFDADRTAAPPRSGEPVHPAGDAAPPPRQGDVPLDEPRPAPAMHQRGGDPEATPGGPAAPARGDEVSTPAPGRPYHQEDQQMAEATGLTSAISYASAQKDANEANTSEWEQFIASLDRGEVSGEAIAASHRAMEAQQQAASAAAEVQAALVRHQQVREAYESNPDAGSRDFVTAD